MKSERRRSLASLTVAGKGLTLPGLDLGLGPSGYVYSLPICLNRPHTYRKP